jgi:hypothetical protein
MARRLITMIGLLLTAATIVTGADRFAVLEFFGRPQGAYCSAAGPAMIALQAELAGDAELLEYDFDAFASGRVDRFWATGAQATYLPLVMVGSGYRTSSGHVDYWPVYAGMIADERARAPEAEAVAFWRRQGSSVRCYLSLRNVRNSRISVAEEAAVWVVVFERAGIGVSNTWVRSTGRHVLASGLDPGEATDLVIDVPASTVTSWNRAATLVLIEDRPGGGGRYDMLQAALAEPAALSVSPATLTLTPAARTAEITIAGPHVLSWTAEADVPWLEVTPPAGQVPGSVSITLVPELRPADTPNGTVAIAAAGDGMTFHEQVEVELGGLVRQSGGRRTPDR